MKCHIHLNCCHLIGKTKRRLSYGQASGSRVQIPGCEPGCSPRTVRTGLRATPFVPQARATAGPCAVFVRIRETSHFLSRPCHFKSLPLALFRGPSFSLFPQSPVFLSFFLNPDRGNSILQDKVRSPFIFVLSNSNFPACFSKAPK